jgi:hypothetical protein
MKVKLTPTNYAWRPPDMPEVQRDLSAERVPPIWLAEERVIVPKSFDNNFRVQ